jgi:hypothetical protein
MFVSLMCAVGTDLCPDKFCKSADELRRGIAVAAKGLFVDDLTDGVP